MEWRVDISNNSSRGNQELKSQALLRIPVIISIKCNRHARTVAAASDKAARCLIYFHATVEKYLSKKAWFVLAYWQAHVYDVYIPWSPSDHGPHTCGAKVMSGTRFPVRRKASILKRSESAVAVANAQQDLCNERVTHCPWGWEQVNTLETQHIPNSSPARAGNKLILHTRAQIHASAVYITPVPRGWERLCSKDWLGRAMCSQKQWPCGMRVKWSTNSLFFFLSLFHE